MEFSDKLLNHEGGSTMKKLKLTENQIVAMLQEGSVGVPIADLCRKYGISPSAYYKLRSKYAGMNLSDLKRLRELEIENNRLKKMYADLSLDHIILKDVIKKKLGGQLNDEN